MPKYFDEDGNEVEITSSLEELQADAAAKAAAEAELAKAKELLAKKEDKEMNWKRLNTMTEEEMKKLSTKEVEIMKRQEELEERQRTMDQRQRDTYKANALARFGVYDEETRTKVLANYDRIKDEDATEEQIAAKMRDAITIATGTSPSSRINPMFAGNAPLGMAHAPQPPGKITGEVADLASKMGISADEIKKYS